MPSKPDKLPTADMLKIQTAYLSGDDFKIVASEIGINTTVVKEYYDYFHKRYNSSVSSNHIELPPPPAHSRVSGYEDMISNYLVANSPTKCPTAYASVIQGASTGTTLPHYEGGWEDFSM